MFEYAANFFYGYPRRITALGAGIAKTGAYLLLAGAIGQVVTTTTNGFMQVMKQTGAPKTLADLYPDWPLWWVPESFIGILCALLLLVFGIALTQKGKAVDRILKNM